MREPRVFLLAVVGFLALSVLHFAVMKGTGAYDREPPADPYELWLPGTGDEALVSGEQCSECEKRDPDAYGIRELCEDVYNSTDEDGSGREDGMDARERSCIRCHGQEEEDPGFP